MKNVFKCHKISEGVSEAEVIVSKDPIMFYLVEPDTGIMVEKEHDLEGKSIANKIIVFPSGKGSSVVQADGIYQLMEKGNKPQGFIVQYPEAVLVSSAIIFEVPMVDKVDPEFYDVVKDGDIIRIDADNEEITILEK